MGTGTQLDGEGHERVNSMLSRSIAMTRFETHENQQMDIAVLLEEHNCRKVDTYLAFTEGKLRRVHQEVNKLLQGMPELLRALLP